MLQGKFTFNFFKDQVDGGEAVSTQASITIKLFHGDKKTLRSTGNLLYAFTHEVGHAFWVLNAASIDPSNSFSANRATAEFKKNEIIADIFAHLFMSTVGGKQGFEPNQSFAEYVDLIQSDGGVTLKSEEIAQAIEMGYKSFQMAIDDRTKYVVNGAYKNFYQILQMESLGEPFGSGVTTTGTGVDDL